MAETDRKRGPKPRDPAPSPAALVDNIPPPPDLDAEGKKHWKEVTARLADAGFLADLDADALHLYCSLWSQRVAALKEVKTKGTVIKAPNGYMMANPWYTIAVQCQKDMRPYLDMFGMSPKSRSKLGRVQDQEAESDEFAEFD
ncbi:MAG: phage terminase small subunit P27 family [Parafilimonas terrae]|nr:phage terminase small subunit P27 family [Parafilimonas terrae]